MRSMRGALLIGCVLAGISAARADLITVDFAMTGAQEVPPNNSRAVGAGELILNTVTQHFSLDMMVYGIPLADLHGVGGNNTPAHIHTAPPGSNGPIVVDLAFLSPFVQDGQGIRLRIQDALFGGVQGNIQSDPNTNIANLLAGDLYVNVHTTQFPGGEIRAQLIVPEPGSMMLVVVSAAAVVRRRR